METDNPDLLWFSRPGGWTCLTNFAPNPTGRPAGTVVMASGPLTGDALPGETTVWLITEPAFVG